MKLVSLKIRGFKNLNLWDNYIDFANSGRVSVFVGNNGSGKSNILEAISAIFHNLYNRIEFNPSFEFELQYKIGVGGTSLGLSLPTALYSDNEVSVSHAGGILSISLNGKDIKIEQLPLPSRIIALYSGEEVRLYEKYYHDSYKDFIDDIVSGSKVISDDPNMHFINKDFRPIALLIFVSFKLDYSSILGDLDVKGVKFDLDKNKIEEFYASNKNDINTFVYSLINKDNLSVEEFSSMIPDFLSRDDVYKMMTVALLPSKPSNAMIKAIHLVISNGDDTFLLDGLSEGEKKLILLYFIFTILADNNSIILLDEPDASIHVGNKHKINSLIEGFVDQSDGECILTTHSPTLMSLFDDNKVFYIESGSLSGREKREILDHLTNGRMSLSDMEIILNSCNEYLLVTEGITDKQHLEIAINKLGLENKFDIFPAGGASKLKQFLVGLPSGLFGDKIIVGIFDYDVDGIKNASGVGEEVEDGIYKVRGDDVNIFGITLPYWDDSFRVHKNFPIEFLYPQSILEENGMIQKRSLKEYNHCCKDDEAILNIKDFNSKKDLVCFKVSDSGDISKSGFVKNCKNLPSENFNGFRPLFEIILNLGR